MCPHFSGCGQPLHETLDKLRRGALQVQDLPLIQVLVGPDENDGVGPRYFSLNNQRLWVWKRLQKEGLLESRVVPERCGTKSLKREEGGTTAEEFMKYVVLDPSEVEVDRKVVDSDDESSDSEEEMSHSNPFSALMMG
ncbi:hypothetical protein HJC23_000261 [Cyclotella cryptica]|uniref:Uncharacterized protein n=1 Tax=Cyclotella cryptica TaxID=29204 RepID=A0ABD3QDA8_9STRA